MPRHSKDTVAILGIDIGKNSFHLVGLNKRGAIVLRQKLSRRGAVPLAADASLARRRCRGRGGKRGSHWQSPCALTDETGAHPVQGLEVKLFLCLGAPS
jgi:hypothetical protein